MLKFKLKNKYGRHWVNATYNFRVSESLWYWRYQNWQILLSCKQTWIERHYYLPGVLWCLWALGWVHDLIFSHSITLEFTSNLQLYLSESLLLNWVFSYSIDLYLLYIQKETSMKTIVNNIFDFFMVYGVSRNIPGFSWILKEGWEMGIVIITKVHRSQVICLRSHS